MDIENTPAPLPTLLGPYQVKDVRNIECAMNYWMVGGESYERLMS
jgi:hypothetical protein